MKGFGENISQLIMIACIMSGDDFGLHLCSNIMTVDFNMFGSFVKNRIRGNMHGGLIIKEQGHWLSIRKP